MNEELKQRLIKYLDGMEGAIDKAADFTVEQAPLVIQDILNWAIARSLISSSFMIITMIVIMYILYRLTKYISASNDISNSDRGFFKTMIYSISAIPLILLSVGLWESSQDGIKALVAPRLYILEQIKDFVNDSK